MYARFEDGGRTGALMKAHDWRNSTFGDPNDWSDQLKTLVSVILGSHQPMFLTWGAERCLLYNDAYAAVLGGKHPSALGQPMAQVWWDIWDEIQPIMNRAYNGISTHMNEFPLLMNRNGYDEQTYFDFSYTPIKDGTNTVVGMFCACAETTHQMQIKQMMEEETARTRQLFDQTPGFIAIITGERLRYEFANQAYHNLVGRDRVTMGASLYEVLPELESQGFFEMLSNVLVTGEATTWRQVLAKVQRFANQPLTEIFVDVIFQPIKDKHGITTGIFMEGSDVTERVHAERDMRKAMEHQRLLMDELNHRVKNTLATVQSMAAQTFKGVHRDDEARSTFEARLFALAKAHDVLTSESWSGADLKDIVQGALLPYQSADHDPFDITGCALKMNPRKTLALTMALHEMATNAVKYGSLSVRGGTVIVQWSVDADTLSLRWQEVGGPPVKAPTRQGFGTRLIKRTLAMEMDGDVSVTYPESGFTCVARMPHVMEYPDTSASYVDSLRVCQL